MDFQKLKLLPREVSNLCKMLASRLMRNVHRKLVDADIAYMYIEHPVILPLILNARKHLGLPIHLVKPSEDFSRYRKVIIPNGLWPSVREATEKIDASRRVFCEIGFFPQARNVYFDRLGVHGHSSIRTAALPAVSAERAAQLQQLREAYRTSNFVRVKWDSVSVQDTAPDTLDLPDDYILVPLQLERDTAFELCPFPDNQHIIDFVESALPNRHLAFKVHPQDNGSRYRISDANTLVPSSNRDLTRLVEHAGAIVGANSTVILEALLLGKKCATYGIGFTTGQDIVLECHADLERLATLDTWEPDWDKVDRFLALLLERQVPIDFHRSDAGVRQLRSVLEHQGILMNDGKAA